MLLETVCPWASQKPAVDMWARLNWLGMYPKLRDVIRFVTYRNP